MKPVKPAATIVCFLCKGVVSYKNKDSSKFQKHMNNEHMAYFGMEFLLAGCTMTEEERLAVKDVIKDRIEPDSESDKNMEEEEEADEVKSNKTNGKLEKAKKTRFQCSLCPISFTMSSNLEEHIAKKHPNKQKTSNTKSKEILDAIESKNSNSNGDFLKTRNRFKSAGDTQKKTNFATISPVSTSKARIEKVVQGLTDKKSKMSDVIIKKGVEEADIERKNLTSTMPVPKKKTSGTSKKENKSDDSSLLAEANQTAGDGKVCPICSKEFPKNGPMRRHFEDIHQPGEFPCSGCQKIFTSKNKMSSHYSRNCNPNRKKRMTS
eukprot:GFUD01007294.1.p1 GENE.GFUD01007294.1~~GFUD01007294.1.p1  ORF type:complete len:321 (-),score=92.00 GFUD01007294.1:37-999(-)